MWRIVNIKCENFISFQSANVEIPQNICTLVYGVNLDNDMQKNNGTGKSSIIEAIAFGLTGEPLRGVDKSEEIINDHSDNAYVNIALKNDYDNTTLDISRTLYRKAPQQIECHKYNADGVEIDMDKTVRPSVLEYNRYILSEIGLTKDDIYSNFILSDSHYKSFFDANDKTKKAMINRFSGADAVDRAIEKLQEDKVPVQKNLEEAKDNKIAVDSKIEVIEQQIKDVNDKKEEYAREKEERIAELQNKIAGVREEIRANNEQIKKANKRLDDIDEAGNQIEDMQDKNYGLAVAYQKINDKLEEYKLAKTKDYLEMSKDSEERIHSISEKKAKKEEHIATLNNSLKDAQEKTNEAQIKVNRFIKECEKADTNAALDLKDIQSDIEKNSQAIEEQWKKIRYLQGTSDDLDKAIREAQNMLHGAITCPKCKHEFFISSNASVEDIRKGLEENKEKLHLNEEHIKEANSKYDKLNEQKNSLNKEKATVNQEIADRSDQLYKLREELNTAQLLLGNVSTEINSVKREISVMENDILSEHTNINNMFKNMLQEALDIIDSAIETGERYIKTIKEKNVAAEASIEAYEKAIKTAKESSQDDFIKSLGQSLADLKTKQSDADMSLNEVQKEFDKYIKQENYFVEFRSYLANKKVETIAGVTNYFLELIGSDLRVEMLGYKRLKNGAIRDKITVNLLRNGKACGEYNRLSGGERARINIASILGLQRLTNNSAENGKGLEFLAADEVLDKADTTGIEAISNALNRLQVTSLIVTQNPISDSEGHTLVVVKQNDYSTIKQDK